MKLLTVSLLIIISVQSKAFGQVNVKPESEILAEIEWLSSNPVAGSDKEFVSKFMDCIAYNSVKYPNFLVNLKALKEFMDNDYKYYHEICIIFSSNQLANKIKTGNKYDLKSSSLKSLIKVLEYYKLLLDKEPGQRNSVLDEYSKMNENELEKHIKKLLKK